MGVPQPARAEQAIRDARDFSITAGRAEEITARFTRCQLFHGGAEIVEQSGWPDCSETNSGHSMAIAEIRARDQREPVQSPAIFPIRGATACRVHISAPSWKKGAPKGPLVLIMLSDRRLRAERSRNLADDRVGRRTRDEKGPAVRVAAPEGINAISVIIVSADNVVSHLTNRRERIERSGHGTG